MRTDYSWLGEAVSCRLRRIQCSALWTVSVRPKLLKRKTYLDHLTPGLAWGGNYAQMKFKGPRKKWVWVWAVCERHIVCVHPIQQESIDPLSVHGKSGFAFPLAIRTCDNFAPDCVWDVCNHQTRLKLQQLGSFLFDSFLQSQILPSGRPRGGQPS